MDIAEYTVTVTGSDDRLHSMNTTKQLLVAGFSAIFGAIVAFAQDSPRPEFEVASIRPSAQQPTEQVTAGLRIDGAQVRCALLTLKDYLAMAYQVKVYQISGPDWIG